MFFLTNDKTIRQKISKNIEELKLSTNKVLISVYRTFCPATAQYTFFSRPTECISR